MNKKQNEIEQKDTDTHRKSQRYSTDNFNKRGRC